MPLCAMQRSCRRRKKSTRWSTTNSTPRSPNSLDSKRYCGGNQSGCTVVHSATLLYSSFAAPAVISCRRYSHFCLLDSQITKTILWGLYNSNGILPSYIFYTAEFFVCFILPVFWLWKRSSLILFWSYFSLPVERSSVRPYSVFGITLLRTALQCCCTVYYHKTRNLVIWLRNCRFHLG